MRTNEKIDLVPIMMEHLEQTVNDYLSLDKDNDVEDFTYFLDEFCDRVINFFHNKACIRHLGRQKAVTRSITGVSESTIYRKCDKK